MDESGDLPGGFFERFSRDPAELAHDITEAGTRLAEARASGDEGEQLRIASALGNLLTIARQEKPAVELLEWALPLAKKLGNRHEEAGVLLNLATAQQYLGRRDEAQALFEAALDCGDRSTEHFIQHHRGRCYAEQGRYDEARLCFQRALSLRNEMQEPRAASTERALEALKRLEQSSPPANPPASIAALRRRDPPA